MTGENKVSNDQCYPFPCKLLEGLTANGIDAKTQDNIVENVSSIALYSFLESQAASLALIACASAYSKVRYRAAFSTAILNNQPMGFYAPAVLVKDAQRHGLSAKSVDFQHSVGPARSSMSEMAPCLCASALAMQKTTPEHRRDALWQVDDHADKLDRGTTPAAK